MFSALAQYTEEKLGSAEKTELDANFENLMSRADSTKNWTEKIFRQTEVLLQPNPSMTSHLYHSTSSHFNGNQRSLSKSKTGEGLDQTVQTLHKSSMLLRHLGISL